MSLGRLWVLGLFVALAAYPFLPFAESNRGEQFTILFVYVILALGLNVVMGYAGLLHLGIAAFFGIGAYTVGILTVPFFPFQQSFLVAAFAAIIVSAAVGVAITAPILRLRGDYFALVTLGLGLITLYAIRNLDAITEGTKGMNPIEAGPLPGVGENVDLSSLQLQADWGTRWYKYPYLYFLYLGTLGAVMLFLRNLEQSRLGRAWVAMREDELASSCMGLNPARLKLAAVALGAGLAGLGGAFYAMALRTTGNPQSYDFTLSMIMVCCVILGGLGNRSGVILGVFLLMGYDRILTNILDNELQQRFNFGGKAYAKVSGWKLMIFGTVLILMMRFRPEGLLPEARHQRELHPELDEEKAVKSEEQTAKRQTVRKQESANGVVIALGFTLTPYSQLTPMAVLSIRKLTMRFGGITAVNGVDLVVEKGQIFSLIGPNGAGKTTVFNAVTGIYEPTEGDIRFEDQPIFKPLTRQTLLFAISVGLLAGMLLMLLAVNIEGIWQTAIRDNFKGQNEKFEWGKAISDAKQYIANRGERAAGGFAIGLLLGVAGTLANWRRARHAPDFITQGGIARTFQNIRLFQAMTVLENILVGMTREISTHPILSALNIGSHSKQEREAEKRHAELLAFVGLAGKHNELAKNLSYGDQRRLEIARAMATNPKLLLLDEPAAGMNPIETVDLMELIRKIRDRGITVMLIEHHMSLVMGISDRVAVLNFGVKIAEGTPAEVGRDPKVIEAYLGQEEVS